MAKTGRHNRQIAFDGLHPGCAALYFAAVLVLSMACVQPVMVALSAFAGIAYNVRLRGWAETGRTLLWQIPLLLIVMLLNPVFSMSGSTALLRVGSWTLYGESLAYGACMGGLLVATFQWFSNAAQVLTEDKLAVLLGRRAPTLGLLLTMTMRLVPQFVRRGQEIDQVQRACTAAGVSSAGLAPRVRQVTVLMGWGMEDSLETADAMRCRGWGGSAARTTYERVRFGGHDALVCMVLAGLVVLCAVCAVVACGGFLFYPVMGPWAPVWCYVPFAVLLSVPAVLEVLQR